MQAFQSSVFIHVEVFTNMSMKRVKIILIIMLATCLFLHKTRLAKQQGGFDLL